MALNYVITLNSGLRCKFQWIFIIADIKNPILGADFLRHYSLLVDLNHNRLVDGLTQMQVQGITAENSSPNPSLLPKQPKTDFDAILSALSNHATKNVHINTIAHLFLVHADYHSNISKWHVDNLNICYSKPLSNHHLAVGPHHYTWFPRMWRLQLSITSHCQIAIIYKIYYCITRFKDLFQDRFSQSLSPGPSQTNF